MSTIKVSSVFSLPPSLCESSDNYVDDPKVGLLKIGESLREIFPHKLYTYQLKAIKALLKGRDSFIAVGTDSGKSEAFLFPMFERILNGEINNAIIIYPTKQLAEDQEKRIAKYCNKIMDGTGKKITYSRYNGDLTQKEIDYVEKAKPSILLATIDKLFYRCFKEGNEEFLDWLLNTGMLVIDEVHAGSGSYLAHVREMVTVLRKVNPKMRVVLASATVRDIKKLRDKFLPTAEIFHGKTRRGKVTVMVLDPEKLTSFLLEKLFPHLQKIRGVAIVFVDNIQKVGEIVAKCNKHLMKILGLTKEQLLAHSPFVCINSQLTRREKSTIIERIHIGLVRVVFTTSLMELGMDIPNIQHIVNVGWPITGVNGLLQRIGRLRFPDVEKKKNFTIFLDVEKTIDKYYIKNKKKLEKILLENRAERILFDSKALQRAKAFVLLRVMLGINTRKEIISINESEETKKVIEEAIAILHAQGMLQTKKHQKTYLERTVIVGDRKEVRWFIIKHQIRAIDHQWEIVLTENGRERKIGTIEEGRILRSALPGNLLQHGSKGEIYRVKTLGEEKVIVEKLNCYHTNIKRNTLKPPLFILEGQARVQQFKHLTIRYGKMIIRKETIEVMRYSRDGKLITGWKKGRQIKEEGERIDEMNQEEEEWKENFQWDKKTKGIIIEIETEDRKSTKEKKKQRMKLLGEIMKKAIEIKLHISETSLRTYTNYQERKIVIYEKGGEMGNCEQVFRKMNIVLEGMRELIGGRKEGEESSRIEPIVEGMTEEIREKIMKIIDGEK